MRSQVLADLQAAKDTLTSDMGSEKVRTPASPAIVQRSESVLGFCLPQFLRALYLEVGNGGFGPGYGIMSLETGAEVKQPTLETNFSSHINWCVECGFQWPPHLLPLIDFGCGIFICIDCSDESSSMFEFDPNGEMEETDPEWLANAIRPLNQTLSQYLQRWLDDRKGSEVDS